MPLIKTLDQGVAAGATINPWQGNVFEFLTGPAIVEVAVLADAGDTWDATISAGSQILMERAQADALALATPITYPDDYAITELVMGGVRLVCQLTNTAAVVEDVRTAARITYL